MIAEAKIQSVSESYALKVKTIRRNMRAQLPGGWFVATNLNNVLKKTIIRLAAEVAGLTFGKDVIVDF